MLNDKDSYPENGKPVFIWTCQILLFIFAISFVSTTQAAVPEQSMETLVSEVSELKHRVQVLEQQLSAVLHIVQQSNADNNNIIQAALPTSSAPASKSASETVTGKPSVELGGRIKAEVIYNSRSVGGSGGTNRADLAFSPKSIPLEGEGEENQFSFNARESRIWLTAQTPTGLGDLEGYLEMDFSSSDDSGNERVSNSYTPRLRHAYASLAGFTAGQTYTTFLNVSAYPELNDANGPLGILNVRQPMLRYQNEQPWGEIFLALEQPESTLTTATGSSITPDDDQIPDIITKVQMEGPWGNWSVAGMLRQIRSDGAIKAATDDSEWGAAISASGRVYILNKNNIRFSLSYGDAIGRYLSFNSFDDGVIDNQGDIELTSMLGGFISYQHWWSDNLRTNLALGYAEADHDLSIVPTSVNEAFFSSHLNLLWNPVRNAAIGVEWIHGERDREDGRSGHLNRIQLSSVYNF